MVNWEQHQKTIADLQQCKLNPDLTISKNTFRFAKKEPNIKYDDIVLCPFCLMSYTLDKFMVRKGLRVCPCCGSQLKLSTLSEINDLDKFVKFVFNYRLNGFWGKICLDVQQKEHDTRFNAWCMRLSNLGLSYDFWEKYKALKGETNNEEDWH